MNILIGKEKIIIQHQCGKGAILQAKKFARIKKQMSFETGEIIDKLTIESEILQSSFPKGCLMSAEDIALASTSSEIDFFSNLETANRILTTLIEYEKKLQRAFNDNSEPEKRVSIMRNQSIAGLNDFARSVYKPTPTYSLPPADPTVTFSPDVRINTKFSDLFGFSSKKPSISGFTLVPPLFNHLEFNGAMYKIAHIALSVQTFFDIPSSCQILPMPSATLLICPQEKRKLYFLPKKSQPIQEIQELQITTENFLNLCITILNNANSKLNNIVQPIKLEEINIAPMLNLTSIPNEWTIAAFGVIKMAQKLVEIINEISKVKVDDENESSFMNFITNEDGSSFDLV